ncbi:hypothetical protein GCM10010869_03510 [Mesorhizobium tianshanense]|uniref:DDE superfamily endonuclease n=1 Tax=Mesorhizobium tianshanense TaxID=39844 RepID=A0A562PBS0_9HYPH|nr:DDE superfamily endonuclease [Mesorhizobium tianshanense]GLS34763.1 hypothetical protein GCM10010869_03510 [Mesorhizobium tianshanense]
MHHDRIIGPATTPPQISTCLPDNITPIFLPSRALELNPVENIWKYMRASWLSNRVFDDYEAIIDAACEAWQKLLARLNHQLYRNEAVGPCRLIIMTV